MVASHEMAESVRLMMLVPIVALSPIRTKRGMLGSTMKSLLAMALLYIEPYFMSAVCANPMNFHSVRLSGNVNEIAASPFLFVVM